MKDSVLPHPLQQPAECLLLRASTIHSNVWMHAHCERVLAYSNVGSTGGRVFGTGQDLLRFPRSDLLKRLRCGVAKYGSN